MNAASRRGQPLIALGVVLTGWVAVRAAVWEAPAPVKRGDRKPAAGPPAAPLAVRALPQPAFAAQPADFGQAMAAPDRPAARPLPQPAFAAPPSAFSQADAARARTAAIDLPAYRPVEPASPRPHVQSLSIAPAPAVVPMTPRIAAGHQLLWLAGVAQLTLPPDIARYFVPRPRDAAAAPGPAAVPSSAPAAAPQTARRWSGDAWVMVRRGGNGFNLPGAGLPGVNLPSGAYGASQAGAVIRYRLAPSSPHRPAAYLRVSSGLEQPRGEEVALGISARPLPGVPVAAMAEARVTRTVSGDIVRPAAALVSEFPPLPLPLGLRGEAYVQAGYVGGKNKTAFADGQARLEKPLIDAGGFQLRAGAGAWGGVQRGAERLDIGPTATLSVPLGAATGRVSADWRVRVAGDAAPLSGPAITLSAGF